MRNIILALIFWGITTDLGNAQNNPFSDASPEHPIYELYLNCEGKGCVGQLQEAARLYDESPKRTMALEVFYFYFASIAHYYSENWAEADLLARQCKTLLAEYENKKLLFWDDEEARYMQGMSKIDKQKLEAWIRTATGNRPVQNNANSNLPGFPQFPFPPPKASTKKVLGRDIFQNCHNLNDVSQIISNAMDRCDYEKSYYSIPNGFALVARLEQMDIVNATSFSAPDRWSASLPPLRNFSDYLKALFFSQEGHYRIVAFLVTDQPFNEQNRVVQHEEAIGWLKSGLNILPDVIGKMKWTETYRCTALIYEFKVTSARQKAELISSKFSAQTHLERSNLLSALRSGKH